MIINVPSDYSTIQSAMDAASPGDEVVVEPGTFHEQNIKFHGKAITVRSTSPHDESIVDETIVRGNGLHPVFNLYADETLNSVIRGLTITSDEIDEPYLFGGGIDLFESSPTVEYNHITANQAQYGGGIHTYLSDARIRFNRITANHARLGGGFHASSSNLEIESNRITHNIGELYGGGLHVVNRDDGGVMLRQNFIHANTSNLGAGVCISGSALSEVRNNIISHNVADSPTGCGTAMGGGLYCNDYAGKIINNSVSHNSAEMGGNLLLRGEIVPEIRNCIISFAPSGNGMWCLDNAASLQYCNVYGNVDADLENMGDQIGENGNFSEDPLFHDPGNDNFHLHSRSGRWNPENSTWVTDTNNSPCIDAGDPLSDFSSEPPGNGARINIGAYGNTPEASKSTMTLAWIINVVLYYVRKFFQIFKPSSP